MIYQQSLRPMRPLGSLSNPQTFGGKDFSPNASEAGPLTKVFGKNNPGIVIYSCNNSPKHRMPTVSLKTLRAQKALPLFAILTLLNLMNFLKAKDESVSLPGYNSQFFT